MVLIDIAHVPEAIRRRRRRPVSLKRPAGTKSPFSNTLAYCIGANDEPGDSLARRSTLDFEIRGNEMPVTMRQNECPILGSLSFSPSQLA